MPFSDQLHTVVDLLPEEEHVPKFLVGAFSLVKAKHQLRRPIVLVMFGRVSTLLCMPPSHALYTIELGSKDLLKRIV